MPVANACACLPIVFLYAVGDASLHVPHHMLLLCRGELLACYDHIRLSTILLCAAVVIVRQNILAYHIVASIERHGRVVKIKHSWVIIVDKFQHTVLELHLISFRWQACAIAPIPLAMYGPRIVPALRVLMILSIQFLWVQSLPPFFRAIRIGFVSILLRQVAIIVLGWLKPCPRMTGMDAHAKRKSCLLASIAPSLDDVFLRTHIHRIPLLIR